MLKIKEVVMIKKEIFRQYDIRGIVGEDLTPEVAEYIGKAFGTYLRERGGKSVCVGKDVRISSPALKDSLVSGLLSTGVKVIDIGTVPTPVLYFSIHHFSADGGIMVTGSHNPIEYNGFKICHGLFSIYGEEIQNLRRKIEREEFLEGKGEYREEDPRPAYIDTLSSLVKIQKNLKVVVDAGNGTAGSIVKPLFEKLGIKLIGLYMEPDGRFPHHLPDPTIPAYMEDLIKKVKEVGATVGIGYDGDADRIGAVDEKGEIVWGDKLLALFSKKILKEHPGSTIIMDVKCSQGVVEYIQKLGGNPLIWKTGHSLIKEKMRKEKALLAGEMSGHMFFADNYLGFDDAIFASLRLLEILSEENRPLSELVKEIPYYYSTPEIRVDCPEDKKFQVVNELKEYFAKRYPIIDVDGVRFITSKGWGLIRASNTQPILVLRFEAKEKSALEDLKNEVKEKLKDYPFVPLNW